MKELPIYNKTIVAMVDDEDFERLSKFRWYSNQNKSLGRSYQVKIKRGPFIKSKSVHVSLASEIMHQQGQMFDHEDRNPLNNQKYNLRPCTKSENGWNMSKRKNSSSQYRGVHWVKRDTIWTAQIMFKGKYIHLGSFNTELEAAKAYNKAALEFFKEFANVNRNEKGEVL